MALPAVILVEEIGEESSINLVSQFTEEMSTDL